MQCCSVRDGAESEAVKSHDATANVDVDDVDEICSGECCQATNANDNVAIVGVGTLTAQISNVALPTPPLSPNLTT